MPTDPGHEFTDVVEQLAGQGASYPPHGQYPPINNSGFAANYATTTTEGPTPPAADIGEIMMSFNTQSQLPVLFELASQFVVCDQWFSSLPGSNLAESILPARSIVQWPRSQPLQCRDRRVGVSGRLQVSERFDL